MKFVEAYLERKENNDNNENIKTFSWKKLAVNKTEMYMKP